jgi:hypothetical protein
MKTYNSPMLHVVSIKKSDIIVTSMNVYGEVSTWDALAPDRRFESWDEGY